MRAAIYARVSTDNQTTENQIQALVEVLTQRGWMLVEVFKDEGISGAKGRDERPALDKMLNAAADGEIDLIAAWSVDRLGRSLSDLIGIMSELDGAGVSLYLHQQAIDTTTPAGKAMFQMLGVFAEFERELIRERVNAGIARAKRNGVQFGPKRTVSDAQVKAVKIALKKGHTVREIARAVRIGTSTVSRIKRGRYD